MMKSILITGGCGFIGVNLIKALLNRGDARILVVDNLSVGTREDLGRVTEFQEIETSDLEEIQRSEVTPVESHSGCSRRNNSTGQRANRPELSWWWGIFGMRIWRLKSVVAWMRWCILRQIRV